MSLSKTGMSIDGDTLVLRIDGELRLTSDETEQLGDALKALAQVIRKKSLGNATVDEHGRIILEAPATTKPGFPLMTKLAEDPPKVRYGFPERATITTVYSSGEI